MSERAAADFSIEVPNENQDSMEVSFRVDPITGKTFGLNVSITDTSLDDNYVGGTDLALAIVGKNYVDRFGKRLFRRIYRGLIAEEFAPIDDTSTVSFRMNSQRLDGTFPDLSVTAFDADSNIVFSQVVYQDGQLFI